MVPAVRRLRCVLPPLAVLAGALAAPGAATAAVRTGTLVAVHGHTRSGTAVARSWALQRANGQTIELRLSDRAALGARLGTRVRAQGTLHGDRMSVRALHVLPGRRVARAAHLLDGAKRVAVILFDFQNGPYRTASRTPASVRTDVFDGAGSLNAYLSEVTGGRVTISGTVYGPYRISPPAASRPSSGICDWSEWKTEAAAAAAADGFAAGNYDRVLFLHANVPACGYAGLAPMSSAPLGMGTFIELNDDDSLRVTSHEWGHTYGLDHSSSYRCTSNGTPVAISNTCTQSEYGDPFDTMGSGAAHWYQAYERVEMGLLSPSTGVQTVTTTGQYTVGALATGTAPRLLRIARGDGTVYGIEFRQPFGVFDPWPLTAPVVNGVTIRILGSSYTCCSNPLPRLIDTNPQTTTFNDAPLSVGRTFTDALNPAKPISIRTDAVSATGATVTIDVGVAAAPAAQAPAAPAPVTTTTTPPPVTTPPPTTTPPPVTPPPPPGPSDPGPADPDPGAGTPPPTTGGGTTQPPGGPKKPGSSTKKPPHPSSSKRRAKARRAAARLRRARAARARAAAAR